MYRYSVDRTATYTSADMVLFNESPFAAWMERLTLENPEHGVLPDAGSSAPCDSDQRQDAIATVLQSGGRAVVLVEWDAAETLRRSHTLAAMRRGAEFIVNGQLAVGPLAASSQLLMRTRGYSELGSYLYVPCDIQKKTNLHAAFRLCFLADLLHSLQGVLPSSLVVLRPDNNALYLNTEDHIYHYRAVKQRFMAAQRQFRKHRMPDPALSTHFGRWTACANDVLRQRALHADAGAASRQPPQPNLPPPALPRELDVPVNSRAAVVAMTDATLQGLEFIGSAAAAEMLAAGQAGDRRRRPMPAVMLGERGVTQLAVKREEPLSHPLDTAGFSVARRGSPLPRSSAAASPASPAPPGGLVDRDDDGLPRRFTPVPFPASLNTSDTFDG